MLRITTHAFLLLFGRFEQFADLRLRLANVLVEYLGSVHDLRLATVEHLADLAETKRKTGFKQESEIRMQSFIRTTKYLSI